MVVVEVGRFERGDFHGGFGFLVGLVVVLLLGEDPDYDDDEVDGDEEVRRDEVDASGGPNGGES